LGPAGLVAWHPRGARLATAADGDGGRVRVLDLERCRAQVGPLPRAPARADAHPPPSAPSPSVLSRGLERPCSGVDSDEWPMRVVRGPTQQPRTASA